MDQVLTPAEKIQAYSTGILPSRFHYNSQTSSYVMNGSKAPIANNMKTQKETNTNPNQQLVAVPRWQYWLGNTGNFFHKGFGVLSPLKSLPSMFRRKSGLPNNGDNGTDDKNNNASNSDGKDDTKINKK